jgi:gliding motility-associated-like protein
VNLKAFDKISGSPIGSSISIPNQVERMQGGVYANNCNEVFVGGNNGNILRYGFNGSSFVIQDTIYITGQLGKSIFDINLNPINNLLYVSGNGFVAAIDQSSTCSIAPSGNIILSQTIVCPDSAFINITNPDPNTSYTFIWTDSTTNMPMQTSVMPVGVNGHGIAGLLTGHTYKVTVLKPSSCQIISNNTSFIFSCGVIDISLCPGQSYTLSNNTTISTPGIYTDTLLNSINQDSIIYINLMNFPVYHDSVYASICEGSSYLLPSGITTNTPGIYNSNLISSHGCDSIITTFIALSTSTTSSVSVTRCSDDPYTLPNNTIVNTSGIYIDTISNSTGCDSIITTELFFTKKPSLYLGKDTELCNGSTLSIDITQPNSTYWWNDNSTFSKRILDTKGIYIASITTSPCEAVYDTIQITACKCDVFIPNAFSPNDDGKNDYFRPTFKCITPPENFILKIYNRWGKEIYFTKLQGDSWDGKYRLSPQDAGTYMYYLKYIDPQTNVESVYRGDIILLR